jgi:predicted RecB family nuclease
MATNNKPRLRATAKTASTLSKSRLMAFRQCARRLWLETHAPELRDESAATATRKQAGHALGDLARRLYDPADQGHVMDARADGYAAVLKESAALLRERQPLFEAGFCGAGTVAFADVLLPVKHQGQDAWRMVEVKSSTKVKDHNIDDAAVQCFAARSSGLNLASIRVANIDSTWTYPGNDDYSGLLRETDITQEAFERHDDVQEWVRSANEVLTQRLEPKVATGTHCSDPFPCGFREHCEAGVPQTEFPVQWLPGAGAKLLTAHLSNPEVLDMRQVPNQLLNEKQLRVKIQTLSRKPWFDAAGAARALKAWNPPLHFLDFETIQFAVPIWAGTRPYQQMPFQFSLHKLRPDGSTEHQEFLDVSGQEPSELLARALVQACESEGSVVAYNAAFEKSCIQALAHQLPALRSALLGIADRLVDLLPIVRNHYYHPAQQGSWSIKNVLPAMVSHLRYEELEGVQDGSGAMEAYLEAIHPASNDAKRATLRQQLLDYCQLDTWAMVCIWRVMAQGATGKGTTTKARA